MTTTHAVIELQGKVGAEVRIELKSTPGTGSVWTTPDVPAGCWIDDAGPVAAAAGIGDTATQRFRFGARKPGRYSLAFELKRPWESVARELQPVVIEIS
jgi:hypothetical protein